MWRHRTGRARDGRQPPCDPGRRWICRAGPLRPPGGAPGGGVDACGLNPAQIDEDGRGVIAVGGARRSRRAPRPTHRGESASRCRWCSRRRSDCSVATATHSAVLEPGDDSGCRSPRSSRSSPMNREPGGTAARSGTGPRASTEKRRDTKGPSSSAVITHTSLLIVSMCAVWLSVASPGWCSSSS